MDATHIAYIVIGALVLIVGIGLINSIINFEDAKEALKREEENDGIS